MPFLNYTTEVPVEKSVFEIQKCLVAHGASAILNEFDNQGYIIAISFKMRLNDKEVGFRLPSDWRPILKILELDKKVRIGLKTQEQALRVAWRVIKDWVIAQMAIIETQMVKPEQVFLPYIVMKNGQIFSEQVLSDPKFLLE